MIQPLIIPIKASDVSGQRRFEANVPADARVGEVVTTLVDRMRLTRNDSAGEPLVYSARLEREGRHLNVSEIAGEALQPNDEITLQPDIQAGARIA
jgi:hypothetical protein